MVFQNYALFPHMTVNENLAFPLEVRKLGQIGDPGSEGEAGAGDGADGRVSAGVVPPSFPVDSSSGSPWPVPSSLNRSWF